MSEQGQGPDDVLAEGGGSGGGSQTVHCERQRISPWRTPALIIVLILAVIFVIGPVTLIISHVVQGSPFPTIYTTVAVIAVIIAALTLYYLFKKSV